MQKLILFLITLLFIPSVCAGIYNLTIGTDSYVCGIDDDICPSDYAGCQGCISDDDSSVDDPDCCAANACGWWCTDAGVVCGDSTNEITKDETDSEGDTVDDTGVEDCYSTGCTTEHVIDDDNSPACLDTYYDSLSSCADDGILYGPYTDTSNICEEDVSCKNTDAETAEDNGDMEICDAGNWHDPDESETYCTAVGKTWVGSGVDTGTDSFIDDYNGILDDGYCENDDGYIITGAVLGETYRGSSSCEPLTDVTISIKDTITTTTIYATDTTIYSSSWSELLTCHEDSGNDVGTYSVTLNSGTYYLVAEKSGYNPVTNTITVESADMELEAFWMYMNAECQSDCTMNDRFCHAECAGVNGCTYATYGTESVATYCDGLREGSRYVLSEIEDPVTHTISGDQVYCCIGEPTGYEREYFTIDDVETSCVENIISKKKVITVNGEVLNLNFVSFSDPKPEKTGCSEYQDFACIVYGEAFC
ncbi:MAG: hypothetical protein WC254_03820 [Candidatus Woesearchaeota archaeon]|jgi:hypothetical protein